MKRKNSRKNKFKYRVSAMVLSGIMVSGSCLPALAAAYGPASALPASYVASQGGRQQLAPGQMPERLEQIFDARLYLLTNPDLAALVSHDADNLSDEDWLRLYEHFLLYGISEGRGGSSEFLDIVFYREYYPDLWAAFGDDYDAYVRHYVEHGIQEGRFGTRQQYLQAEAEKARAREALRDAVSRYDDAASDDDGNFIIPWEALTNDDYQLTMQDLERLCGDSLVVYADKDGNVLYIGGNCSSKPVVDEESAERAVNQLRTIIGMPTDYLELLYIKSESSADGSSTFYMFRARDERTQTVAKGGAVYIEAGSTGEVLAVSTTAPDSWENAPERKELTDEKLLKMDEYAKKYGADYERAEEFDVRQGFIHAGNYADEVSFVYYRDNSGHVLEMALYADGTYDVNAFYSDDDFDGETHEKKADAYSYGYLIEQARGKTITREVTDLYGKTVELQMYFDESAGKYYLVDPERKIVMTESYATENYNIDYSKVSTPYYFSDPEDLDEWLVTAWWNVEQVADTYKEIGFDNAQRNVPIVVTASKCESNQATCDSRFGTIMITLYKAADNASFDTMAHEMTHGVQMVLSENVAYYNESGAIMESIADIMSILIEQKVYEKYGAEGRLGYQDMVQLLYGEELGEEFAYRNFKNPNAYGQSAYVGDIGYVINVPSINDSEEAFATDNGGVHINSGILNNIAYRMYKEAGISADDLLKAWYDALVVFNADQTYATMGKTVIANLRKYGVEEAKLQQAEEFFEEAGAYSEPDTWAEIKNDTSKSTKFTVELHDKTDDDVFLVTICYDTKIPNIYRSPTRTDAAGVEGAIIPNGVDLSVGCIEASAGEKSTNLSTSSILLYIDEDGDGEADEREADGSDVTLKGNVHDIKAAAFSQLVGLGIDENLISDTKPYALITVRGTASSGGKKLAALQLARKLDDGDNLGAYTYLDKNGFSYEEDSSALYQELVVVKDSEYKFALLFADDEGNGRAIYTADQIIVGNDDGYVWVYEIEDGKLKVTQTTSAEANEKAGETAYRDISALKFETQTAAAQTETAQAAAAKAETNQAASLTAKAETPAQTETAEVTQTTETTETTEPVASAEDAVEDVTEEVVEEESETVEEVVDEVPAEAEEENEESEEEVTEETEEEEAEEIKKEEVEEPEDETTEEPTEEEPEETEEEEAEETEKESVEETEDETTEEPTEEEPEETEEEEVEEPEVEETEEPEAEEPEEPEEEVEEPEAEEPEETEEEEIEEPEEEEVEETEQTAE